LYNYSSQIAIYLKNNFNYKRVFQQTNTPPQQCMQQSLSTYTNCVSNISSINDNNSNNSNTVNVNTNILSGYFHCYVEDYMVLPIDELILLCIPDEMKTFVCYQMNTETNFGMKKYRMYYCKMISAPHCHL
jgi:hypothetical protein